MAKTGEPKRYGLTHYQYDTMDVLTRFDEVDRVLDHVGDEEALVAYIEERKQELRSERHDTMEAQTRLDEADRVLDHVGDEEALVAYIEERKQELRSKLNSLEASMRSRMERKTE